MAAILASEAPLPPQTPGRRALLRLRRRRGAMVALAVVAFFALLALLAPYVSPYDPLETSWSAIRQAPSAAHLFGTDDIGDDILSRVIAGGRLSLSVG
ncbi:MAG: ABC transporter permease, partial [Betaproteobacteria bacterium]|nr:ABC transporter permease [Betaproteobacteria bacterium]